MCASENPVVTRTFKKIVNERQRTNTNTELSAKNIALLDEVVAFTPNTTEVQNLHNIFTMAVESRGEAYAQILEVLTDLDATEEAVDAAFDLLEASDAMFLDFADEVATMKNDLGFVVN